MDEDSSRFCSDNSKRMLSSTPSTPEPTRSTANNTDAPNEEAPGEDQGNLNLYFQHEDEKSDVGKVPVISVHIEPDNNADVEIQAEKLCTNFLHPATAGADSKSISSRSSRSSRLSSAMSFVSVASSRISSRVDVESGKELCGRSLGLLLAFVSGVIMTAYSSMLKMLVEMDSTQVVVIRGFLQLTIMGCIALYKQFSFIGARERFVPFTLFLVALTGGLRLLFLFIAAERLPIGDFTTIMFSSPVFVMLLSICILKERCGIFRVIAGVTLLVGVLLIAKPPIIWGQGEEEYDLLGYSLNCLACLMSALGLVLTKKIAKQVEKIVILFYLGVASVILGLVGLFTFGEPANPPLWEWGMSVGIGLLGLVQQYFLIYAVTLESPARVQIVRTLQIVLAYVVQVVLFDKMPVLTDFFGAALVLGTIIAITFEKQMNETSCCKRTVDTEEKTDAVFKDVESKEKVVEPIKEHSQSFNSPNVDDLEKGKLH
eukprot:TRINITY_DN13925_c0_g1_i1.p1 TRINITY_DN13925_c0_g1~~TRINITY_DN13925_c0_g1_i1.p1  ORF type:complete len:486 (+),score=101.79 TRINITY_DN13925_c0_g1_i1:36-1493(+)